MRVALASLVCSALFLFAASGVASATSMTLSTADNPFDPGVLNQGWWSQTISVTDDNDNFAFGGSYRNFFTFDLSPVSQTITAATLRINGTSTSGSGSYPITYGVFDVSTAAATLNNNVGTSSSIWTDLGSGTSYGSAVFSSLVPVDWDGVSPK